MPKEPWHTPDSFTKNPPTAPMEESINGFDVMLNGDDPMMDEAHEPLPNHRAKKRWTIISGGE
jgi:hypothetical protein